MQQQPNSTYHLENSHNIAIIQVVECSDTDKYIQLFHFNLLQSLGRAQNIFTSRFRLTTAWGRQPVRFPSQDTFQHHLYFSSGC